MTEQEWLTIADPKPMLEFLRGKASNRKWVLFATACRRRLWDLMEAASRNAVVVVEQLADGQTSNEEAKIARDAAWDAAGLPYLKAPAAQPPVGSWYADRAACGNNIDPFDSDEPFYTVWTAGAAAATRETRWDDPAWGQFLFAAWVRHNERFADRFWDDFFWEAPYELGYDDFTNFPGWIAERREQAALARCIFGNPFRPVTANSAWLTATVILLAQAIYDERAFDRLPILADALEDAGCDHADILNHCRQPGDHVRGCWVVDLLLAKE